MAKFNCLKYVLAPRVRNFRGFTAAQIAKSAQNFHCYELLTNRALNLTSPCSKSPFEKKKTKRNRKRKKDFLNKKEVNVFEGSSNEDIKEEISNETDQNRSSIIASKRATSCDVSDTRRPRPTSNLNVKVRSPTTSMDLESSRLPKTPIKKGCVKPNDSLNSGSLGNKNGCVVQLKQKAENDLKMLSKPNHVDENAINKEKPTSSIIVLDKEPKDEVENSKESDCQSPWDSTVDDDQPEISSKQTVDENLQDSLWDSDVDMSNAAKEANEFFVSSITQISETSGQNFSLLEDLTKASKVLAQDPILLSSPKHTHSPMKKSASFAKKLISRYSLQKSPRILNNLPHQSSDCDFSTIDERTDEALNLITESTQRNQIKNREDLRKIRGVTSSIVDFSHTKLKGVENTEGPLSDRSQKSNSSKSDVTYSIPTLIIESEANRNEFFSHDPQEMEFIQEQLVESLKVLDREESSHRALEMELNGARQQLLTASVIHREGSSSQNISEPIFKFEQLRNELDEEKNQRLRLEGIYKSMKNQLSEKDEELFRIHSVCQDMDAELQLVKMELKESESVKANMKVEFEESIRSLMERSTKITLDRSSSPIAKFWDDSKLNWSLIQCEKEIQFTADNSRISRQITNAKMELSCIRNDLINTKANIQFDIREIQGNLSRLQNTILDQMSSYCNKSTTENERLKKINRDLELLNEKNNAVYEAKLVVMQDRLNALQNIANEKEELAKQLELQDTTSVLNRERENVKNLKISVAQDDDKRKQMSYEIEESHKRVKDASERITCLFKHLKSLEQSTHAVYTYLDGIIRKTNDDGDIHSNSLLAEEISKMKELLGILDLVQKSAKNTMAEVTSSTPELNSVEEVNVQRNERLLQRIGFSPDFDHSRNIEEYLIERILQLKGSESSNPQLSKPQNSESVRVTVDRDIRNISTESVGTMTDLDVFMNKPLQTPARVAFIQRYSPSESFETAHDSNNFADYCKFDEVNAILFMLRVGTPQKDNEDNQNCINLHSNGQNLMINPRYREYAELEQLREENESLRKKINLMKNAGDLLTRERLQRRIRELEAERNQILIEKQILEEDALAEHRLADKLLSQSLQRRRSSRHLSQSHASARRRSKYGGRQKVGKSRSKTVKKSDSDTDDESISDQLNGRPTIRPNTNVGSKETWTDKVPSRDFAGTISHNPASATSLLLQKARMNLQAVERNLQTTSTASGLIVNFQGFPVTSFCIPERYAPYLDKVLVSNGMIKDRLQRLAGHIVETYEYEGIKDVSIMCVLKGGFKFFSDLVEEMQRTIWARKTELCITVEFIRVKSYTDTTSGQVNIRSIDNAMPIRDKNILVVDDICDTGKTMTKLCDYLYENGAKTVKSCCLLLKHTKLNVGYRPHFLGFEIPDEFIVGYAIDYNECFRDLLFKFFELVPYSCRIIESMDSCSVFRHICSINDRAKKSFASRKNGELVWYVHIDAVM
ncbi:hypothetical protein ACTXT7_005966 [Hymenolepis weldensis]